MTRSLEVRLTVVHQLAEGQDPTIVANAILADSRDALEGPDTLVHLNAITLKEGRRVIQRLTYRPLTRDETERAHAEIEKGRA